MLFRSKVKVPYVSLVNLIAGKKLVNEYIQNFSVDEVANEVVLLLTDKLKRKVVKDSFEDIRDRMLFAEALETAKTFEEGVITSAAAANIGSIMGIGFPPNTGGAAQFMTGYEDKATGEIGLGAFLKRADELAEKYGDRFRATPWLRELAASGKGFPA